MHHLMVIELSVICCHTINFAGPVTPQVVAEAIINCNLYDGMNCLFNLEMNQLSHLCLSVLVSRSQTTYPHFWGFYA